MVRRHTHHISEEDYCVVLRGRRINGHAAKQRIPLCKGVRLDASKSVRRVDLSVIVVLSVRDINEADANTKFHVLWRHTNRRNSQQPQQNHPRYSHSPVHQKSQTARRPPRILTWKMKQTSHFVARCLPPRRQTLEQPCWQDCLPSQRRRNTHQRHPAGIVLTEKCNRGMTTLTGHANCDASDVPDKPPAIRTHPVMVPAPVGLTATEIEAFLHVFDVVLSTL
jgi:hypothetical protein